MQFVFTFNVIDKKNKTKTNTCISFSGKKRVKKIKKYNAITKQQKVKY